MGMDAVEWARTAEKMEVGESHWLTSMYGDGTKEGRPGTYQSRQRASIPVIALVVLTAVSFL